MTMIVETAEEAASICSTRDSSLAEMEDQEILKEVNADHCRLSIIMLGQDYYSQSPCHQHGSSSTV